MNPRILGGKPAIRGTRISVEILLRDLAEILDGRPGGLQRGPEHLVVVLPLDATGGDLGGDLEGAPDGLGDLDRLDDALLGDDAPDEAQKAIARLTQGW